MATNFVSPLIAAGAVAAVAIALAPAAAASGNTKECDTRGAASVCQKKGHASINASPEATRVGNTAWPFGTGPMPPMWAFD